MCAVVKRGFSEVLSAESRVLINDILSTCDGSRFITQQAMVLYDLDQKEIVIPGGSECCVWDKYKGVRKRAGNERNVLTFFTKSYQVSILRRYVNPDVLMVKVLYPQSVPSASASRTLSVPTIVS